MILKFNIDTLEKFENRHFCENGFIWCLVFGDLTSLQCLSFTQNTKYQTPNSGWIHGLWTHH